MSQGPTNPITNTWGGVYQVCPISATTTLGAHGAVGDFLGRLVITVATAATGAVSIKDGGDTAIPIIAGTPGGGIGVYSVDLSLTSRTGAWQVVTLAGATVLAIGNFTP